MVRCVQGSWLSGLGAIGVLLFGTAVCAQGPGGAGGGHGGGGMPQGFHAQPFRNQQGFAPSTGSAGPDLGTPTSLRDFLFGGRGQDRRSPPPVARYRIDGGSDAFVMERTGGSALVKFGDSQEIWALTAMSGPRGDTIFKNDVGEPVLRFTRLGGVTLFTPENPDGAAALMTGAAGSVRPSASIGPNALFAALATSSARASRAAQHLISFEIMPDATPKTDWLFADAAIVAAEAFIRLASQGLDGRSLAARFGRVEFLQGGQPQAQASGGVVHITVAPGKGVAGRPSSQRILLVLSRR